MLAPIGEELGYRGMAGAELRDGRCPSWLIWLVTSIAFATAHTDYTWQGMASVFLSGSVFWLLWHKSGSIWPGVAAHSSHNGLLVILELVG